MAWLSESEISEMGFGKTGKNALLSNKASYYNCKNIRIGNNVRVDDFCVLSAGDGGIDIGSHIHIAVYSSIIGKGNVYLADFCNISSRVSIYSSNDDYSGTALTNPTIPEEFSNVLHADVAIGRHVIIGSGSIVLPGVRLEEGVAIGALSLVNKDCLSFGVYAGIPVQRIGDRQRSLLSVEKQFKSKNNPNED